MDRGALQQKAQRFFEEIWSREDAWNLDTSPFEQARFSALIAAVQDQRYRRVLEIGCGAGAFTAELSRLSDSVLAIDIAPTAIEKAHHRLAHLAHVSFRTGSIMEIDVAAHGPFDLIVFSETIYYLGWMYPFFDLAWLASELYRATSIGGRLLLANTQGVPGDYLLLPAIIWTYRDLFRNVGYQVQSERTFAGVKDHTAIEVLITLFAKPDAEPTTDSGR
jgi:SAM-dependent methyltransferase